MSVPKYKRNESSTEFLKVAEDVNVKVGGLAVKMPVKYKTIYGDDMAKTGLEAYRLLQTANGIYLDATTSEASFDNRITMLETAKGYLYNLPSTYRLCNKVRYNSEHPDTKTKEKWIKQGQTLSELCAECVTLINGTIRSDKKRYKEYNQNEVNNMAVIY